MKITNQMFFPMLVIVRRGSDDEYRHELVAGGSLELGRVAQITDIRIQHHAPLRGIEVLNPEGDTE